MVFAPATALPCGFDWILDPAAATAVVAPGLATAIRWFARSPVAIMQPACADIGQSPRTIVIRRPEPRIFAAELSFFIGDRGFGGYDHPRETQYTPAGTILTVQFPSN